MRRLGIVPAAYRTGKSILLATAPDGNDD
jgi:hypothetical protein